MRTRGCGSAPAASAQGHTPAAAGLPLTSGTKAARREPRGEEGGAGLSASAAMPFTVTLR